MPDWAHARWPTISASGERERERERERDTAAPPRGGGDVLCRRIYTGAAPPQSHVPGGEPPRAGGDVLCRRPNSVPTASARSTSPVPRSVRPCSASRRSTAPVPRSARPRRVCGVLSCIPRTAWGGRCAGARSAAQQRAEYCPRRQQQRKRADVCGVARRTRSSVHAHSRSVEPVSFRGSTGSPAPTLHSTQHAAVRRQCG